MIHNLARNMRAVLNKGVLRYDFGEANSYVPIRPLK
jgi:hypothetical protein